MAKKNPVLEPEEAAEAKDDPLHEAREQFKRAEEYWDDDRRAALEDIKFRAGEQWPEEILAARQRDKRPALTLDKLNQYVRQIVNDGRQNRPAIKVRPVDSGADIATAEVFQGIIKHIEEHSNADAAYDTALDSAATCGQGYFRVLTEYSGDETFDQDIVIKRIRNPMNVLIDPDSQEADASDMKYAFIIEEMPEDDFEAAYPDATPEDWETNDDYSDWYGNHVRVVEHWYVEERDRKLHMLVDGTVISEEKLKEAEANGMELTSAIKETRNIPERRVMFAKMCGSCYLEEPKPWLGKWIPILAVWGNEIDLEGKVTHSGIIRPGKDPQRLYNYSRSAFAERVALTPKAPWVAAEGQIEDFQDEWETANIENHSVLRYRPISLNGAQVPAPQRTSASDVPAGFAQDMQISEHDIQAAIGMYAASLGAPSNERSGKAIMARQREGDVGTFHYHDNLNRAIRQCGRILVDLIPKIYDSNRVVRILGYDGTPGEATVDPSIQTASAQQGPGMIYNLGVGRYDVAISTGPSYNTLRQESAQAMIEMVQANPELMGVIGDLMIKNMDWPGAEEISERLKLTLPPEIQQAEAAKKQKSMPPEMQQIVSQFDQALQEKDATMEQAAQMIQQLQTELAAAKADISVKEKDIAVKSVETEIKSFEAETERFKAEEDARLRELEILTNANQAQTEAEPKEVEEPESAEPELGIAELLQALAAMQQPINITVPVTVDGKGQTVKQGKAVRQADGSYIMESIETPVEG